MPVGKHARWDVRNCESRILDREYELRQLLIDAAEFAGATIMESGGFAFEPREPRLPAGATCYVHATLAESHAWIHTYPENNVYFLDVFTCGNTIDPEVAAEYVIGILGGERHKPVGDKRGDWPD